MEDVVDPIFTLTVFAGCVYGVILAIFPEHAVSVFGELVPKYLALWHSNGTSAMLKLIGFIVIGLAITVLIVSLGRHAVFFAIAYRANTPRNTLGGGGFMYFFFAGPLGFLVRVFIIVSLPVSAGATTALVIGGLLRFVRGIFVTITS